MKKWIAFLLLFAMMLSLTACKGENEQETQPTESVLTEELVAEETTVATEGTTETTEATTAATEEPTQTESITETETEAVQAETFWAEENLEYPMAFYFSSGAGAWGTELNLNEDGTFTGSFRDSNMGESGEGYPNGTAYVCNFSGKFGSAQRLDDYTYGIKLLDLTLDRPAGEEWIEDGLRYVSATPYGLENSEDFVIYLPDTPVETLSEDVWFWWPGRYYDDYTTLNGYGLCNLGDNSCFFYMTDSQ